MANNELKHKGIIWAIHCMFYSHENKYVPFIALNDGTTSRI